MLAADRTDDARDRIGMARAVEGRARVVDVDAVERGRESVRVALAAHLAVGDDVEAGALLIPDGQQRRVVLRLLQELGRNSPQLVRPSSRWEPAGEPDAVDQPVWLGVGPNQTGRQQDAARWGGAGRRHGEIALCPCLRLDWSRACRSRSAGTAGRGSSRRSGATRALPAAASNRRDRRTGRSRSPARARMRTAPAGRH